jgi:signal transduction histidine kinase
VPPNPTPTPPNPGPDSPGTQEPLDRGVVLDPSSLALALDTLQKRIDLLQQSLTQQNKLATLGMVTAVIAHEFNNILTPMIAYTRFALGDKADEPLRTKALSKALGGAERMANISKSLLGFARGDETVSVSVLQALRDTLACLARDPAKDGITLSVDVPENLVVAMNAGHLQQVLMNLIVNARSAMLSHGTVNSGGKRIALRAAWLQKPSDSHGKMAEITLADTGPGIPAEVLPHIFDPFFSTKRAADSLNMNPGEDTMPRGGTGLGLTICQELIRLAGGTIRVTSKVGAGTIFTIELPAATSTTQS